ncbi:MULTISPECIES: TetR/AcrR family transcriptional regulator C-terminal domain-containing protein [Paraburkholderia]|uniref:TetR/AcrR family transcriptional regulator C-terminal domain-containing protein n=1 Tax=Paraburkholderia TaxID=1822464 RepID=UPI0022519680|nr:MULTISPECIES: TetR/AcrR family transcriptional regulator C-terminal domain-containing protein [Paraburkholderia]MCX4162025.1 TetR/AcrR family transcriptional regulator C-terminal domain-containing protein [Paraburkholderia megapolitana]MDN7157522.1 TetR/AcrR family transcriptional regulator C-terminal domain-containing protein [Paraburkholderia sp. CHISQ3]MDQ6494567.1 TetR/AcrR family transcriptional regulator C-terminal domain-containing protein [Paraburkholderia megapolitana]
MAKIRRDEVVSAALELLDVVGLDGLSTRRLAEKLGVESATLYWHFRDKSALLAEMASLVLARHHTLDVPEDSADWPVWFADNARSFRRALLTHRDGALLHAGTTPNQDELARIVPKVAYLVRAGFSEPDAQMALLAAGQFTLGCVLEEQARDTGGASSDTDRNTAAAAPGPEINPIDPDVAFEFGLGLIINGLRNS